MMKHHKKLVYIAFLISLSLTLFSCKKAPKYTRYDLSNFVSYMEAPPEYNLGEIIPRSDEFKSLNKKAMKNLNKLTTKDENFIWLKIQFFIPQELKNKEIGLYIGYIRGADILWINNTSVRQYGDFPPRQSSAGFTAQYFMFADPMLKQDGLNTIFIKIWPDAFASIASKIYISEKPAIYSAAESMTFFNSKITMAFAGVMMVIFFMYLFLYFVMKKDQNKNVYLFFALLNFYTVHFLLPFFFSEVVWAKPYWLSYNAVVKFFFYGGALATGYFANSFVVSYLRKKESKIIIAIRLTIFIIPMLIAFSFDSTKKLNSYFPVLILFDTLQFAFSIPHLIIALIKSKSRMSALNLLTGFSPVLLGVIIDVVLKVFSLSPNLPFFSIYGWQITLYIFLATLLLRFGNMYKHNSELNTKLSEFNTHLEEVVAMRTKELSEANFVLSKGLETVAHVQKNFLPVKNKMFRGWELSISYNALDSNVSGDLYDYYFTEGILDGLGIFDVSGHGIPAGLMTILAKSIISQHFITGKTQAEPISNVLEDINKSYIKEKVNVENYITGILFRFSEFNQKDVCSVEFANAGHPYPLFYSAADDKVIELKQDEEKQYGILGVEGLEVSFPPISFRAAQDDIIVCFTDGLTDCSNLHGDDFSKDRIIKILQQYHDESAIMIMNRIMDKLEDFKGNAQFSDDVTLIVLKRVNSKDYIEEI